MQVFKKELLVNILTYAIKSKSDSFSKKDFKNVMYTQEFENFDINKKIAEAIEYLVNLGLLQIEDSSVTFYEKYKLSNIIKINTKNYTNNFKYLAVQIIDLIGLDDEKVSSFKIDDKYVEILFAIKMINRGFLSNPDREVLRCSITNILLSLSTNKNYTLFSIIQFLKLGSCLKFNIQTESYGFNAVNVRINHIEFKDESIVFFCDKCSFELDNIENIILIESQTNKTLEELLLKSLEILKTYPSDKTEILKIVMNKFLK